MNRKIYFAGSIRGGREDASLYKSIIDYIKKEDVVLTEHIGNLSLSKLEGDPRNDSLIYKEDTAWLRESDLLIAEISNPSLGVGYELAYAESINKPCYCFYDLKREKISAMVTGNPYFNVYGYENEKEIYEKIDEILGRK